MGVATSVELILKIVDCPLAPIVKHAHNKEKKRIGRINFVLGKIGSIPQKLTKARCQQVDAFESG